MPGIPEGIRTETTCTGTTQIFSITSNNLANEPFGSWSAKIAALSLEGQLLPEQDLSSRTRRHRDRNKTKIVRMLREFVGVAVVLYSLPARVQYLNMYT